MAFETAKATHSTPLLHIAEEGLLYNNTKVQSFIQLVKRVNTPTRLIDTIILHVDTVRSNSIYIRRALLMPFLYRLERRAALQRP